MATFLRLLTRICSERAIATGAGVSLALGVSAWSDGHQRSSNCTATVTLPQQQLQLVRPVIGVLNEARDDAGEDTNGSQLVQRVKAPLDQRFNGVWRLNLPRWLAQRDLDEYLDGLALPWYQKQALKKMGYAKAIRTEWNPQEACWTWSEDKILPIGTLESEYKLDGVRKTNVLKMSGTRTNVSYIADVSSDGRTMVTDTEYTNRSPMRIVCTRAMVPVGEAEPSRGDEQVQLRITDVLTTEKGDVFSIHYHFDRTNG